MGLSMRLTEKDLETLRTNARRPLSKATKHYLPLGKTITTNGQRFRSKLEARYDQYLQTQKFARFIKEYWYEPFSIKLARKTFYKPDFLVETWDHRLTIIEVKGYMREDANVKLKVAARCLPCFRFLLARWQNGAWVWEEVAG